MRSRNLFLILFSAVLGFAVINFDSVLAAKDKIFSPPKIGIVSVMEVFEKCDIKSEIEKAFSVEGEKIVEELKALEEGIANDKAALNRLKPESEDYLQRLKSMTMRQAEMQAKEEFYQRLMGVKEMQGKEKIYRKILETVKQVAEAKELDMIISRDDNYLTSPEAMPRAQSPSDLALLTKTHKLLYYNKELDITGEVIAVINQGK